MPNTWDAIRDRDVLCMFNARSAAESDGKQPTAQKLRNTALLPPAGIRMPRIGGRPLPFIAHSRHVSKNTRKRHRSCAAINATASKFCPVPQRQTLFDITVKQCASPRGGFCRSSGMVMVCTERPTSKMQGRSSRLTRSLPMQKMEKPKSANTALPLEAMDCIGAYGRARAPEDREGAKILGSDN